MGKTNIVRKHKEKVEQYREINGLSLKIAINPVVYVNIPAPFSVKKVFLACVA